MCIGADEDDDRPLTTMAAGLQLVQEWKLRRRRTEFVGRIILPCNVTEYMTDYGRED